MATLSLPVSATGQGRKCITAEQNVVVVRHILPPLVDGLAAKCRGTLNGAAYLNRDGRQLAERLRPDARAACGEARTAIETMVGNRLPDNPAIEAIVRDRVAPSLADGIVNGFQAKDCGGVDQFLEAASSTPSVLGPVLAFVIERGIADNQQVPYRVCR